MHLVYKRYCVVQKLPRYDESEMCYMRRKVAHKQCPRTPLNTQLKLVNQCAFSSVSNEKILCLFSEIIPSIGF